MRIGGGTRIKINKAALYKEKPEKQLKAVSYISLTNPDKWMICKTFEKHYEVMIMNESQNLRYDVFKFTDVNEANKKFKELYLTDSWKKEE